MMLMNKKPMKIDSVDNKGISWKIDTDDESVKRVENKSFIHEFDKIAERES